MKQIKSDFLFWSWFTYYLSKNGIDKLDNNQIEVNTSLIKTWKLEDLHSIRSVKTAFSVKTHEETLSLNEEFQSIQLLNKEVLDKYIDKG